MAIPSYPFRHSEFFSTGPEDYFKQQQAETLKQLHMLQQMPPPEAMRQQAQFHQAHIRPTDAPPQPNPVLLLLTTP